MRFIMFSVRDLKAEAFLPPVFVASKGSMIRNFEDACNDSSHQFCKHAEDFVLFELGVFEDSSGAFEIHPAPIPVIKGFECKKEVIRVPHRAS